MLVHHAKLEKHGCLWARDQGKVNRSRLTHYDIDIGHAMHRAYVIPHVTTCHV